MKYIYSLLTFFLFVSCASIYNSSNKVKFIVDVDAYGDDSYLVSKKYILFSTDSTVNENSLQYVEFADYVRKTLNAKGYKEVTSWDEADLIIYFGYGISDPETFQVTRSIPVWGKTGISSINTTSNTTGYSRGSAYGSATKIGNTISGSVSGSSYGHSTTSSQTSVTPSYGVVGYRQESSTITTYFRFLTLDVYDLNAYKTSEEIKIVWNTTLTSKGSSDDLRRVIPYMITVGSSYFGTSSGQKRTINIYENDERVNTLRGLSSTK